ncbi:MAG: ABC transporter ATP-binding protein [Culicoidibacterales bacterium]
MMNKSIIKLENVSKSYGKKVVLNNINITLDQGIITCLQGANGAGKTTMIKIICKMIKLDKGTVHYNGLEDVRYEMGYMSQSFSLYKNLTIKENLSFFARIYNVENHLIKEQIKKFKLDEYENYKVKNLSGGWKQKVSLACATLHDPKFLILDEPTAGVDPVARKELWEIITNFANNGKSILVTTHYIDEVFKADKVIFINEGQVALKQLSPNDLLAYYNIDNMEELYYRAVKGELYEKN